MGIIWTIWKYLSDQKRIHHPMWIKKNIPLVSSSIDGKILTRDGMRFEKKFKFYLKNQWQWSWEQTWFDRANTFHAIMSTS